MDGLLSNQPASPQKALPHLEDDSPSQSSDPAPISPPHNPKVGSSIATLWLKVGQENQPPASIPSTLASGRCPQCETPLPPPLQSSGRQVCMKCGWTNKPRHSNPTPTVAESAALEDEPTNTDLLNLLEKAASESLKNMQPRKKPKR